MTRHLPDSQPIAIYDAAMLYKAEGIPLAVIAGKEYGSGSSRDWAAKGPRLLGVRVVFMDRLMRFEQLRVKAVFCAIASKFFKRMPNAPVVGTPENGERSDLRLFFSCPARGLIVWA